jgi:predicted nucleic acid-binding protein
MTEINGSLESRCFIDTNIWLYAFIQTEEDEKFKKAQQVIAGNEVIISSQIINEICVNLLKKGGFEESRLHSLISAFYKKYTVFELSQDISLKASEIRSHFSFSFWDSLVAATAIESEARFLISEDMRHGFKLTDTLSILNPLL